MVIASVLAIVSGVGLGTTDYFGGRRTDRHGVLVVLVTTQSASLIILATVALSTHTRPPTPVVLLAASLAGACELVGTAALYRGLGVGRASTVAPAAALGPVVTLAVDLFRGDSPSSLQIVGVVVAVVGIVVVSSASGGQDRERGGASRGLGWGLLASAGFGGYLALIGIASRAGGAVAALLVDRAAAWLIILVVFLVVRVASGRSRHLARLDLIVLAGIGTVIALSDLAYAVATTLGIVTVAAALSSTHPAFTVLWSRFHGHQPLTGRRLLGLAITAAGAAAIVVG